MRSGRVKRPRSIAPSKARQDQRAQRGGEAGGTQGAKPQRPVRGHERRRRRRWRNKGERPSASVRQSAATGGSAPRPERRDGRSPLWSAECEDREGEGVAAEKQRRPSTAQGDNRSPKRFLGRRPVSAAKLMLSDGASNEGVGRQRAPRRREEGQEATALADDRRQNDRGRHAEDESQRQTEAEADEKPIK